MSTREPVVDHGSTIASATATQSAHHVHLSRNELYFGGDMRGGGVSCFHLNDNNVFRFSQPGTFTDLVTEVSHNGARGKASYLHAWKVKPSNRAGSAPLSKASCIQRKTSPIVVIVVNDPRRSGHGKSTRTIRKKCASSKLSGMSSSNMN